MEYANLLLALGGDARYQVPKYAVTPAEVAVLRFLHGDDAVTDIDVRGTLSPGADDEKLRARTDRQEIERLRGIYSYTEGDKTVSRAVSALFGSGIGVTLPKSFADLELDDSQFTVRERKVARDPLDHDNDGKKGGVKNDADGYHGMTVNELRAKADKDGVDLTGLTKKDDIIAALELNDAGKAPADTGSVFE